MKTKRLPAVGICIGVLALAVTCTQDPESPREAQNQGSRPTLHYFTWSDYVGPEILAEFERREQARVVVDLFSSNEELLAKLQSGVR